MPLPTGKVSPYKLLELVFPELESDDEKILVGPDVGLDASVIGFGDEVLVFSSDPITGALKDPGWLSVNVNANDVAAMGASPEWFLLTLFLPEGTERADVKRVMKSAREACDELGVSIVGGHTEVTPGLGRVLISGAMAGIAPEDRWVSAAMAEPGDDIIFTKTSALEGTFILALDREEELKKEVGIEIVDGAKKLKKQLSVVEDALTAVENGEVHAMHDPTEGGLLGGLFELADASNVGFSISSDKVFIAEETESICNYFGIDPFKTIGSGSLLICSDSKDSEKIVDSLENVGIKASIIGEILEEENKRSIDGNIAEFPEQDELWKIFE